MKTEFLGGKTRDKIRFLGGEKEMQEMGREILLNQRINVLGLTSWYYIQSPC
jgi:hypothetical protein